MTMMAKRFGFSERYVKQRLRLADVAPEILDEVRKGEMSVAGAMAYASTSDQSIQLKVFRGQMKPNAWRRHFPLDVTTAIASEAMSEASPIFKFIDRATYEREGGDYEEDLFSDLAETAMGLRAPRKLSKGQLARDIASRCLTFQADRVLAEARREMPSVVGLVIPSTLQFGGKVEIPSGYAAVEGGWNGQLGMQVSMDECWERAIKLSAPIYIEVGIVQEKPIGEDDDGSPLEYIAGYCRQRFYVPRELVKQVLSKKQATSYGSGTPVLTEEQRAEQELQADARLWAARLVDHPDVIAALAAIARAGGTKALARGNPEDDVVVDTVTGMAVFEDTFQ